VAVPNAAGDPAPPVAAAASATNTATSAVASAPAAHASGRAQHIRETAENTRGIGTYITLFVILVLSGLGLPLPEEVPLLLAGYLASHQSANLYILILVGLAGALSSDVLLFMATHRYRSQIFRWRWTRAIIRPRYLVLARRQFHNHGLKIVIVARWLPALRSAVCLTAGLTGIKFWRFMLVDATAACITVPTSILLGYYAGTHIDRLISGFERAERIVLLTVLIAAVAGIVVRFVWWRHTASPASPFKPAHSHDGPAPHGESLAAKSEPRDKTAD
jgi:membrane protein DedA with SNARE-associated domain